MRSILLFSGGKDSIYSLEETLGKFQIKYIISINSESGDTQLHAGPESDKLIRKSQLKLLGVPFKEITISSNNNYMHELFVKLNRVVKKDKITHIITGDLWHPYTSGIGDMLAAVLGIEIIRPAREICPDRKTDIKYMNKIIKSGIESIIISVRQGVLPKTFVGRKIDKKLVKDLAYMKVDAAGEGGEYQSLVLKSTKMQGRIVIDDFMINLVEGKNGKEKFYRMSIKKFHIEK